MPGLDKIIETQTDQQFSIDMDIGNDGDDARIAIKGLKLELKKDEAKYDHVAMPGKNGPNSNLSSGVMALDLIKEGSFINQMGTQIVKTIKGCWEVVWRKDAPAGALICGFEIPEAYMRNEATLPKGRAYVTFPLWTRETLTFAQQEKIRILARAKECLEEKDAFMQQYANENNILKKALHYRNAYAAAEQYWLQPVKMMESVPEDHETFKIQDDLFLTTKGTVWSKDNLSFGQQVLLGTANIAPVVEGWDTKLLFFEFHVQGQSLRAFDHF